MGPTWVLSAPDGPHVGPMNLAIRDDITRMLMHLILLADWLFQNLSISIQTTKKSLKLCITDPLCWKSCGNCWIPHTKGQYCKKHAQVMMFPDSKVLGANMGPTWVLSAPDGPHVGFMNFAIRVIMWKSDLYSPYFLLYCVISIINPYCAESILGHIYGSVQERRNFICNALELRPSCTNPSTWCICSFHHWILKHRNGGVIRNPNSLWTSMHLLCKKVR